MEGGGDLRETRSRCRQGFAEFFGKVLPAGCLPRVIACGGRNSALDDFGTAVRQHTGAFIVLLVDSEGPVDPRHTPWEHLRTRDHWNQPAAVADDQVHLMVQCMEAWFLADRDALTDFYGPDFNDNALPSNPDIEHIAKTDVIRALENATRHTSTKGRYHKTYHGFKLLGLIDPIRVRGASTHANRLCAVLVARAARQ